MRVLVDGLSATSYSGRHVLFGHLQQLARTVQERHDFFVLVHPSQQDLPVLSLQNVHRLTVPSRVSGWKRRTLWELFSLGRLIRQVSAELLFTPAGFLLPGCSIPQVCLAQNPWCLTPILHQNPTDRIKAYLQRRAYRNAVTNAALMAYNSEFMRVAYRRNAPRAIPGPSLVAYQGLDDETHDAADKLRKRVPRQHHRILTVSVMAPWKNIETLINALQLLRARGIPASLSIVGPWADIDYERLVRAQIGQLGLESHVSITGAVSRSELYQHYAEATVFCLLSRCESFGIPALEAQRFGTPAVISDGCAMPEICGAGGISVSADEPSQAAEALARVLEDPDHRRHLAGAAIENASKYRWSECSRPLLRMFDLIPDRITSSHAARD